MAARRQATAARFPSGAPPTRVDGGIHSGRPSARRTVRRAYRRLPEPVHMLRAVARYVAVSALAGAMGLLVAFLLGAVA